MLPGSVPHPQMREEHCMAPHSSITNNALPAIKHQSEAKSIGQFRGTNLREQQPTQKEYNVLNFNLV